MRDVVLVAVVGLVLLGVFKHPVWGAYLWAWVSLMNPHKLTFGFAFALPIAQAVAAVTLLMWAVTKSKRAVPLTPLTGVWYALFAWMTFTSFFALNQAEVLDRWIFVAKIQLMLLVTLMLVADARQLKILVVVVTLSVAVYGIKGGLFVIKTAGGERVWGPPGGLLQGNNELAVGLVMLVPYLYWMRRVVTHPWLKRALLLAIGLCMLSILGSQSRGALLAIVAMTLFLALKSGKPVQMSLLLGVVLVAALAFMPDSWTHRMETINSYQDDSSAMSRLWTWTTMWNAAVDRPLVGVGFRADSRLVFNLYAPKGGEWAVFDGVVFVAHSIYFQMLGEHGFVGLFLFLAMWGLVWLNAARIGRQAQAVTGLADWLPLLMRMTQVSVIGFMVGGAFLSLAYLDLVYYMMGYVIIADRLLKDAARAVPASAVAAPQTPPALRGPGAPGRSAPGH